MGISYLNILSLKLTTHIGIMIHKKLTNESSLIPIFLNIVKMSILMKHQILMKTDIFLHCHLFLPFIFPLKPLYKVK